MRVLNPNAQPAPPVVTATDRTDLQGALLALAAVESPDGAAIRAALAAGKRARFTDGWICQVAQDLGLEIVG